MGYYDDNISKGSNVNGFKVLGAVDELTIIDYTLEVIISIADPRIKKKIYKTLKFNSLLNFPSLIHPNVLIGKDEVIIGYGCIICASNIITVNIVIGNFVILNLGCTVGHDSKIGDYSSFMPSVNISGEVIISEKVYVGTGAKIINQIEIGENSIIGAGAVVSKSIPSNCTAVGVPAKPTKFHND